LTSCAFWTEAEIVSANESDWLVLIMDDTADGTLEGSMGVEDKSVMGPEWSFWAAVMVERVAGARDVPSVGSAMMRVDALRIRIAEHNLRCVCLVIVESIFICVCFDE